MPIDVNTREALLKRADHTCECKDTRCKNHFPGRCDRKLIKGNWEAHRIIKGGPYTLNNLRALCEECHENTKSYGKH